MVQTPVQGPTQPAGYQTGVPSTPVSVSPGVISTIPYPSATGGAVPTLLSWVVVLNSSPYTLLVTSGATVTQIAAFTSDCLNVIPNVATSLTLLPQPGLGQVVPGSDSTVYATWYEAKPPGQYPAALGSGATNIQVSDTFFSDNSGTPIPSGGQKLYGPVSTVGFAATRFALAEVSGTGPLIFTLGWLFATGRLSRREIILPPAGICEVITPNLADIVQVLVTNNTALNTPAPEVEVIGLTQPVSAFNADAVPHGIISHGTNVTLANGAHTTQSDLPTFPGPASLNVYSTVASGGLGWTVTMFADIAGDHTYSSQIFGFGSVGAAPGNFTIPPGIGQLILPPVPTQLVITNALGGNSTFSWSLIADAFRVG